MGIFSNLTNINNKLDALLAGLQALQQQGATQMAVLDDLHTAVTAVQTAINNAVTLIQSLHQSGGGGSVSDADVEAVVTELNTAAEALGKAQPQP